LDRSLKGSLHSPYWIFNLCATQTQAGTIAGRALTVDAQIDPAPNEVRARCSQFRADRNNLPD
jgi:hypothetical protein